MHVRDAAVADEHLVAVEDPFVAVAPGGGLQVRHVASALWLRDRQRGQLEVARLAEELGRPAQELVAGKPPAPSADSASAGITMLSPMPAQPQKISSMKSGSDSPVGSAIRSR